MTLQSFSLWLTISGPNWLRGRAMHVSDRMFLRQTLFDNLLLDMLYEFLWLPLVELKNTILFIIEGLAYWAVDSIVVCLDTVFPEPKYNRVRYGMNGLPITGSRALRFLTQHYEVFKKFVKYFPVYFNDPNSSYYWKYYVGYFWHQTIKRELFGHRWNPKRNMMVLVEMTAGIFLIWAVGWHFKSLMALVWFDAPLWYDALTIVVLIIAELLAVGLVRFMAWIEFFKYEIEFFYTSPWYQDGGKLNGRTLVVNLIWRAMNALLFLAIATYCPKAIDPRVYDIVMRACWWLAPMIIASTALYFIMPVFHFIESADEMNKTAMAWTVTIIVLLVLLAISMVTYQAIQMGIPDNFSLKLPHIDWSFLNVCRENCSLGTIMERLIKAAKILCVVIVVVGVIILSGLLIRAWAGQLKDYRERLEDNVERLAVYQWLWWIPSITVILFWSYFIPCYYQEVYLPDKLKAASMVTTTPVPVVPTVTLTYTPAITETPFVTITETQVPTATFTTVPNTPTATFTSVPNTPTATFTRVPSETPSATPTWTPQPGVAVTQDMNLPEAISPDASVTNCGGAEQGSSFVISVDPDKGYCIPGLTPYNVEGARFNIGNNMYVVAIAVTNEAAWYYLDGNFPFETTTCTLNGATFTGGRNNFVTIKNENTDSRLRCTFTDANGTEITITGTAWK